MQYRDRNADFRGDDVTHSPRISHYESNSHDRCRMVLTQVEPVDTLRQTFRYIFYTAANTKVRYSPEQLPSWLHLKLSMINSMSEPISKVWSTTYGGEADCYVRHQFLDTDDADFKDIGWRCYKDTYVIVMTTKQLKEIDSGKREES